MILKHQLYCSKLLCVSQVCSGIKSMPCVVYSSSCTSNYKYRITLFTEIACWVYSKFKNKVLSRLKYFTSSKHCIKFPGKENTTGTEAYKTERTKDIFGNACVFITTYARLFARAISEFPPRPSKYTKMTSL